MGGIRGSAGEEDGGGKDKWGMKEGGRSRVVEEALEKVDLLLSRESGFFIRDHQLYQAY